MNQSASSWSRRRAAVAEEAAQEENAVREAELAKERDALAEKSDEEILETLGLPDPDSMVSGDDFKAFMSKTVPEHLRKRALRKLWRSNPVLACVDGLNDYDDDYLAQSLGQGAIKTSYQVGKGMLAHLLEVERAKAPASGDVAGDAAQDRAEDQDVAEASDTPEAVLVSSEENPEVDQEPAPASPRRMQFQFKDETA